MRRWGKAQFVRPLIAFFQQHFQIAAAFGGAQIAARLPIRGLPAWPPPDSHRRLSIRVRRTCRRRRLRRARLRHRRPAWSMRNVCRCLRTVATGLKPSAASSSANCDPSASLLVQRQFELAARLGGGVELRPFVGDKAFIADVRIRSASSVLSEIAGRVGEVLVRLLNRRLKLHTPLRKLAVSAAASTTRCFCSTS